MSLVGLEVLRGSQRGSATEPCARASAGRSASGDASTRLSVVKRTPADSPLSRAQASQDDRSAHLNFLRASASGTRVARAPESAAWSQRPTRQRTSENGEVKVAFANSVRLPRRASSGHFLCLCACPEAATTSRRVASRASRHLTRELRPASLVLARPWGHRSIRYKPRTMSRASSTTCCRRTMITGPAS